MKQPRLLDVLALVFFPCFRSTTGFIPQTTTTQVISKLRNRHTRPFVIPCYAAKKKAKKRGAGGGGFGSVKSAPTLNKKTIMKRVQQKYGGTTPQEIAAGTQKRMNAAMQKLPPHMLHATQIYQQLQKWNAHLGTMTILQQAGLPPEELEGAARAQQELERLYNEHDFTENDLHNIFQQQTWDASADAKTARAIASGNKMPDDIQQRVDRACEIVAAAVQNGGGRCLDVGCGFGVLVPHLVKKGVPPEQIVGVDLSPEMIRNAQDLYPESTFEAADFLQYRDDKGFDAVLFCSALHDLPDMTASLKSAASLLRPGGKLVILHAQGASHVLKQVRANPVMVKRGLPLAEELRQTLPDFDLVVEPVAAGSPQEEEEGYLAVLQK